jgi:hypothetical protein
VARKRDPVAEYIAAHPDRVHGGQPPPRPVEVGRVARARPGPDGIIGWCSVTGRAVYGRGDEPNVHAHATRDHPERLGCRIDARVDEHGRVVPPEWASE